ncbi:MAG TPA: cysteine desulfurase-like protein [Mycobacteriales bacterium]|nr:cysteine desulfurase-like protein [Mycobacteriales bacterium]
MSLDPIGVRAQFPAITDDVAQLDGPGGTQTAEPVAVAVADALRAAVSNRHGPFAASERAERIVVDARQAAADLLNVAPSGVVLGPNMTTVTLGLARALRRTWSPGDEVVLSRLDHDANIRPWVIAARDAGATVRWAEVDVATGDLPVGQYADLVTARTRLVAVTSASNAIGTMPDVRAIADIAHAAGALVHVDGVHATPHHSVDVAALGADFYACSSYKFYGPHLGMTAADPALWAELTPDKLLPSPDSVPDRFETGTMQFELLAGLTACVDYIASLAPEGGTRRDRLVAAMTDVTAYESALFAELLAGLRVMDGIELVAAPARRSPTVAFNVAGWAPADVAKALGAQGICVWAGHYYAFELMAALGLGEGGAVRVGIAHYNTRAEIERLLAALRRLTG